MDQQKDALLDQIVVSVVKSRRYRHLDAGLVRSIAQNELPKRRNPKETVKAVKNKLHQVGGAYLEDSMLYDVWLKDLQTARQTGVDEFRKTLLSIMGHHASTRERLPLLDEFYTTCLAGLPPFKSVLDLACGLNPLSIPWMGLAKGAHYHAVDIYKDMMGFLSEALASLQVDFQARTGSIIPAGPFQPVELALVLKTIPCLEQVDSAAGKNLLDAIQADVILVSFPLRSLGGRDVGMAANYEKRFLEFASGKRWKVNRFEFQNELVFQVSR